MDANFGLVHKSNSGVGHGRHNSRHKDLFFMNHLEMKKFIDDYAADTKSVKNVCKFIINLKQPQKTKKHTHQMRQCYIHCMLGGVYTSQIESQ